MISDLKVMKQFHLHLMENRFSVHQDFPLKESRVQNSNHIQQINGNLDFNAHFLKVEQVQPIFFF